MYFAGLTWLVCFVVVFCMYKLSCVIAFYWQSYEFECLSENTKVNYCYYLKLLDKKYGQHPINDFTDRGHINNVRNWVKSFMNIYPEKARYVFRVLKILLNWAYIEFYIGENRTDLYKVRFPNVVKKDTSWSNDQIAFALQYAPIELKDFIIVALETGLRSCSLRDLKHENIKQDNSGNSFISIKMPKLKHHQAHENIIIPMTSTLQIWYDSRKNNRPYLLTSYSGDKFSKNSLSKVWRRFKRKHNGKFDDVTLHGLRKTTVTRLAMAGCTVMEIAAILGWSIKTVNRMLEDHYFTDKYSVAQGAIEKVNNISRQQI